MSGNKNENENAVKLEIKDSPIDNKDLVSDDQRPNVVNVQPLSRKKSSYVDIEKARKEARELLDPDNANDANKGKLMFEEKKISIFRLYGHLNQPIDFFYMVLGFIGSIGSGISMPLQAFLMSDLFSDIGNTSETESTPEALQEMFNLVDRTFDKMIREFLVFGAIAFVCNFLSVGFWSQIGRAHV